MVRWEWLLCFYYFLSSFFSSFFFFLFIKRNEVIFNSRNFSADAGQNATFSLLTCLRLKQFYYLEIGNFPDDFKSFKEIHYFETPILTTFMMILSFWSVTSFLHQDRQVSQQFYDLNKICDFCWLDILHLPGIFNFLWKKHSTYRHSTLPSARIFFF